MMRTYKHLTTSIIGLITFFSLSARAAESCKSKSVLFVGRVDYAAKVEGRIAFKSDYIEIKETWKLNSAEYRKMFLAYSKKTFPDYKKTVFKSEFSQQNKVIATKKANVLAPIQGSYHEIEKLNFQKDMLNNIQSGTGELKIIFTYDCKIICEQLIQII